MAIGTNRVQVYKQEQSALGGNPADDVAWPEPIKPQEDAIESCGVYFQDLSTRDQFVYIARAGDDLTFRDKNNTTPVTLTQLLTGSVVVDYGYRRHFLLMGG